MAFKRPCQKQKEAKMSKRRKSQSRFLHKTLNSSRNRVESESQLSDNFTMPKIKYNNKFSRVARFKMQMEALNDDRDDLYLRNYIMKTEREHSKEKEGYEDLLEEMRLENQNLKQSLAESRQKNEWLQRNLTLLQNQGENMVQAEDYQNLSEEVDVYREENDRLKQQMQVVQEESEGLREENEQMKERVAELEEEIKVENDLKNKNHVRQEEYLYLQETIESNQAQLLELTQVISNLKQTLAQKQEVIDRVCTKETEFVQQIKTLKDENVTLKEKVAQTTEQVNQIVSAPTPNLTNIQYKEKFREDELTRFKEQEDTFMDVELVKLKEVTHLAPIIKFCFQVYEEKSFKYLFGGTKHVSIEIAEKYFKENLKLEPLDAFLLARYVIEPREQPTVVLQRDRTAYRREILSRLKSIGFKKITEKDFHALEKQIRSEENKNCKQKFYDEMQDLAFLDIISKDDILGIIKDVGIKIDNHVLLVLLCRESKDMNNINGEVILRYIDSLYEYDEKQEKANEKHKKQKKVQISTRVTTVNYDKEDQSKNLYTVKDNGQIEQYNREDSTSSVTNKL